MSLPIVYLPKIKPADVLQIILRRIDYRIENTAKKNIPYLEKIRNGLSNNKELTKLLEEQYDLCPQSIIHYLKIMQLILTLDVQNIAFLEAATQNQINTSFTSGFQHYAEYSADYKTMAKNLFISNLSVN